MTPILFLLAAISNAHALIDEAQPWLLPPILAEGAATDLLSNDAVVPSSEGTIATDKGSGAISRSMQNQLPLTVLELGGRPGNLSQLQGLGFSEDNTTLAFGIPLNPAQGGGFDLSIFPQYLWSSFAFRSGPVLGNFDPRGVAGTLRLTTWTEDALTAPAYGGGTRLMSFYSDVGVTQLSLSGRAGTRVAAVAGYSDGDVRGPSGVLSGKWGAGRFTGRYHLLATRLEADLHGSRSFPTPGATQLTARVIPVIESDFVPAPGMLLKSSVFFDAQYLRNDTPSDPAYPLLASKSRQLGMENALLWEDMRIGLGARVATYNQLSVEKRDEVIFNTQVSRSIESGFWLLEPTVQLVGVSGLGILPTASLGIKRDVRMLDAEAGPSDGFDVFGRVTFSRRFPSLVDRYGFFSGFLPNPDLKVEKDWTGVIGTERRTRYWRTTLQFYAQLREDAQITLSKGTVVSPTNSPLARVYALSHSMSVQALDWLRVSSGLSLTNSRMSAQDLPIPRLPGATAVLGLTAHHVSPDPAWDADLSVRGANASTQPSGAKLAGYGYADFGVRGRVLRHGTDENRQAVDITGRVENLFDRPIQFVEDYPTPGRVYSVSLIGQF